MGPDLGSWQSPDISRSHLYRGTIAWTPPTAIYRAYTVLVNGGWGISYEIALGWMPLDLTDEKSTLVQVMAWCRQATSHYLSQFDPDKCCHMASLGHNELTHCISILTPDTQLLSQCICLFYLVSLSGSGLPVHPFNDNISLIVIDQLTLVYSEYGLS